MDAYSNAPKVNARDILKEQRLARLRQVFARYRVIYSELCRDQLKEKIIEEGQCWGATVSDVSQVMQEFYERQ